MKPFIPSKIAEVLFALVIAWFGYNHFKNAGAMGGWVPDYMPGDAKIWIYVVGACFVLAAIAILTDIQKVLACYLLAGLLMILAFAVHWKAATSGNAVDFLKNTAMAMTAILVGNKK